MDDLDHGLIAELRRDGRASISELADRLQVSRATVRLRLERLKAAGVSVKSKTFKGTTHEFFGLLRHGLLRE